MRTGFRCARETPATDLALIDCASLRRQCSAQAKEMPLHPFYVETHLSWTVSVKGGEIAQVL
jgi:hypothetical protein